MKKYLSTLFTNASKKLSYIEPKKVYFNVPKIKEHGDLATNYPLTIAKTLSRNPRDVAQEIISNLTDPQDAIEKIEIAGPGFLNFKFKKEFISSLIKEIIDQKSAFGRSNLHSGKKAQVEFVSANPTGPLTVGHGRNAVFGDTIANILEWVGFDVDREYYFNNAGRQMRVLGDSVRLRYLSLCGESVDFPEDYYQGEYITDIAKTIFDKLGNNLLESKDENYFKEIAEREIFKDIAETLNRLSIKFDSYFNENTLYEEKKIDDVLQKLKSLGFSYESEGAIWLSLKNIGMEADKVIVKSSGEPTYRLPDIAYHIEKFKRNYDLMIDIFGSDHMATFPDVLAGLKILGYDESKVKVLIHQFVTIMEKGEVVKMSTRKANFITLDQLIDEVGADVVRYFFLMRSISSHLNFDLDLAKKHSDENPVFYLQYAHARICGILRLAKEEGHDPTEDFKLLIEEEELELIKHLQLFPEVVESSASNFEPLLLITFLHDLAGFFHKFYHNHRVLGQPKNLTGARLSLCLSSQIVLQNGLKILGISAPEKM
ncbi:MAG: arginine--tRNA ligase [Ignavibacteria bacterium]|nr:arginine--tRNA ligase [Ignavibacteria bacterium]